MTITIILKFMIAYCYKSWKPYLKLNTAITTVTVPDCPDGEDESGCGSLDVRGMFRYVICNKKDS